MALSANCAADADLLAFSSTPPPVNRCVVVMMFQLRFYLSYVEGFLRPLTSDLSKTDSILAASYSDAPLADWSQSSDDTDKDLGF